MTYLLYLCNDIFININVVLLNIFIHIDENLCLLLSQTKFIFIQQNLHFYIYSFYIYSFYIYSFYIYSFYIYSFYIYSFYIYSFYIYSFYIYFFYIYLFYIYFFYIYFFYIYFFYIYSFYINSFYINIPFHILQIINNTHSRCFFSISNIGWNIWSPQQCHIQLPRRQLPIGGEHISADGKSQGHIVSFEFYDN